MESTTSAFSEKKSNQILRKNMLLVSKPSNNPLYIEEAENIILTV